MRIESLYALRDRLDAHRAIGLEMLRIYLGVALFIRGGLMLRQPELLMEYTSKADWFWPLAAAHYVILAHLAGGLLLAIGLLTRAAAAVQVPALLGAVFVVHLSEGLLSAGQGLELASLVLVLLGVFVVFGGGRLSADHYISMQQVGVAPRRRRTDRLTGPDAHAT